MSWLVPFQNLLVLGLDDVGVSHEVGGGWSQSSTQISEVSEKIQMTNFIMPNNTSSMKYALKSIPGLADVGVPHGDGDGPRTPPRCLEGVQKNDSFYCA